MNPERALSHQKLLPYPPPDASSLLNDAYRVTQGLPRPSVDSSAPPNSLDKQKLLEYQRAYETIATYEIPDSFPNAAQQKAWLDTLWQDIQPLRRSGLSLGRIYTHLGADATPLADTIRRSFTARLAHETKRHRQSHLTRQRERMSHGQLKPIKFYTLDWRVPEKGFLTPHARRRWLAKQWQVADRLIDQGNTLEDIYDKYTSIHGGTINPTIRRSFAARLRHKQTQHFIQNPHLYGPYADDYMRNISKLPLDTHYATKQSLARRQIQRMQKYHFSGLTDHPLPGMSGYTPPPPPFSNGHNPDELTTVTTVPTRIHPSTNGRSKPAPDHLTPAQPEPPKSHPTGAAEAYTAALTLEAHHPYHTSDWIRPLTAAFHHLQTTLQERHPVHAGKLPHITAATLAIIALSSYAISTKLQHIHTTPSQTPTQELLRSLTGPELAPAIIAVFAPFLIYILADLTTDKDE